MTAYDRTAYWVQTLSTGDATLYSPSVPPSEMGYYLSSPPSDAGSAHSIPPRMILRYEDGRPDIPISRAGERPGRYGGRGYDTVDPRSYHDARHRGRQHNTSYANPSFVDAQPRRHDRGMHGAPEEIRVLPAAIPHGVPRSRSMPRSYDPAMGPVPQTIQPLPPSGPYAPVSHAYQRASRHSRPEGHAYPSSVTNHAPYPPTNYSPHIGPNSVIYSHSAPPVLMRQGHSSAAAHSRTGVPEHLRGILDTRMGIERSNNSRARAFSTSGQRPGSKAHVVDRSDDSSSDSETDTSYYATRSRGKTPISTPSTGKSVATATSSGYPATPTSAIYGKRPFFQRLFNFAGKFSHTGPSRASSVALASAGDLHRRHSISGSRR